MAEMQAGQGAEAPDRLESTPRARMIAKAVNLAGAAVSLALIGGIGIWGYKLIVRDVSGVPVVRAVEGPMRVQPDSPGGRPAAHQGLAVNEVAGQGTAAPPPDRLTLAPSPVALRDEDAPLSALQLTSADDPVAPEEERDETPESRNEALLELADEIARDTAPLGPLREAPETSSLTGLLYRAAAPATGDAPEDTAAPAEQDQADTPEARDRAQDVELALAAAVGEQVSLRPKRRPEGLRRAALSGAAETASASDRTAAASVEEVDPDSLAAGTRLVQLGAYDSPEVARDEWDRLAARFDAYIEGKSRVVQRATSGGRVFYRLRAMGFDDISDARRFCAALMAENAECIPVVVK
ncbi:MAG: SPOR domain-containing protein [Paracoccaceae bacterium]